MTDYPKTSGRYGPIYRVAPGLYVKLNAHESWWLVLSKGKENKKKSFGKGEAGLVRALKAAELLAAKLDLALSQPARPRTFGAMAEEWFRLNAAGWRPGTQERYDYILRTFLKPLEYLPLEQVQKVQVKHLLADLLASRSPNTVQVVHAVISGIFTEANELGYLDQNPARGLLRRLLPAKKRRVQNPPDPFTAQDLAVFLQAAWQKLPPTLALILETMAMSGLRLGECLALRGDHLDGRHCQYQVTESTRAGRFGPPKTGTRLVDLDPALVTKLESHIRRQRQTSVAGGSSPGGYLFPGISQRMVQRAMARACRFANLRARHPHDLRHTYATLLLMDHYSPAYVQKQLGHASISITVDTYGHWLPGEGRKDLGQTLRQGVSDPTDRQAWEDDAPGEASPARNLVLVGRGP
ncbi:MAG: site-specific integrase, partial [Syntrophobacterales bacterium]